MRVIYLDENYMCHTEDDGTMLPVETDFFDGRCKEFVEGYRFVPEGHTWVRADGEKFVGELAIADADFDVLARYQQIADRESATRKVVEEAGITIAPKPTIMPTKPGYPWRAYERVLGSIIWDLDTEYHPDMPGTMETPIEFEDGMEVYQNYFYTRDGERRIWLGRQAAKPDWDDANWEVW